MRFFAFISTVNTLCAWSLMFYVVYKTHGVPSVFIGFMTVFLLAIFSIDRGFKHLDIKAGKDGISAKLDSTDTALSVQTTTTVSSVDPKDIIDKDKDNKVM